MAEQTYSAWRGNPEYMALPLGYTEDEWAELLRLTEEAAQTDADPPPVRIHLPDGRLHYTLQYLDGEWRRVDPPEPVKLPLRSIPLSAVFPKRFIYFIGADSGPVKIGYSVNPKVRMRQLQAASPRRLKILAQVIGEPEDERAYHARFAAHRLHGEWFERHPDILAEIDRLTQESLS